MQPKFTLKKTVNFLRIAPIIIVLFCLFSGKVIAQPYINGNLSTGATHVGTGTVAPAGYTWSELQGSNGTIGFSANISLGTSLADNFVIPPGNSWNISKITFFAYSTNYAGTTSPFVDTRVQIYDTDPSVGNPAPIFGDLTTNRFLSSTSAFIYRTGSATASTARQVWKIETTVTTTLLPGTYWVEWANGTTIGVVSNFTPPSTVVGQPSPPGANSKQRDISLGLPGTWTNVTDAGNGGPQDQYFIIDYTPGPPCVQGVFTSVPTNKTIVCGENTSFTVAATGSLLKYSWQQRVNTSSPWTTVTDGGLFSGATTKTLNIANAQLPMSGYQFRALITGPCTAIDFSSPPATLTVNPLVAAVSGTPTGNICLGTIKKLSITNTAPLTNVVVASNPSLGITIPDDASTTGVNNSVTVSGIPAGVTINAIRVKMDLTHSWAGDMIVVVKAPNGNILNLAYGLNATGGAGPTTAFKPTFSSTLTPPKYLDAGSNPYNDIFSADGYNPTTGGGVPTGPDGFLPTSTSATRNTFTDLYTAPANSSTLNGTWTLAMFDYYDDFLTTNKFNNWSVEIDYSGGLANGVWTSPAPNSLFTDAAATIAYDGVTPLNTVYAKPASAGTTNYSVVVNNGVCTSAPFTVPVTVVGPVANVVNPRDTAVCVGKNASFKTSASSSGPFQYKWEVSTNNGVSYTVISGATSATLSLTAVTQAMNNNLYRSKIFTAPCLDSVTTTGAKLTVNPLPTVTITSADLQLLPGQFTSITGTSSPAAATAGWLWKYNGSTITGVTGNTVSGLDIDKIGTYQATVTDVNGCVANSNSLIIGTEVSDKLWIYPNMTTGAFQVRLYIQDPNVTQRRDVAVYNSSGQLIVKKALDFIRGQSPYSQVNFDLSNQAAGTYLIKVTDKRSGRIVSGFILVQ